MKRKERLGETTLSFAVRSKQVVWRKKSLVLLICLVVLDLNAGVIALVVLTRWIAATSALGRVDGAGALLPLNSACTGFGACSKRLEQRKAPEAELKEQWIAHNGREFHLEDVRSAGKTGRQVPGFFLCLGGHQR